MIKSQSKNVRLLTCSQEIADLILWFPASKKIYPTMLTFSLWQGDFIGRSVGWWVCYRYCNLSKREVSRVI